MSDSFHSREELEHVVVLAHARGSSIRELSATLKISRNTVRRIVRAHRHRREQGHDVLPLKRAPRARKLDAHVETMQKLLDEFPDINGQRMLEELRQAGYAGGITQVRERLQELRPRPKREPTVRFETAPGEQGQFDWSPYNVKLRSGKRLAVLCFSYILGFSRRHFIDFTLRRDFHTLIRRHVDTFTYFQGVPAQCLYDGEKTVLLRWEGQQPIFNPAFLCFIMLRPA
jgi:transposase